MKEEVKVGKGKPANKGKEEQKEESKGTDHVEEHKKKEDHKKKEAPVVVSDWCIRAKMNMQDKVKCLRDPVFYRVKR